MNTRIETQTNVARPAPIQRLDPRMRVFLTGVFALVVVSLSAPASLIAALLMALTVLLAARLPLMPTLRRVAAMDMFILVMIAFLPFTTNGTPLFHLFGFPASQEGLLRALQIGLTANAIVMMMLALVGSLSEVRFAQALSALKTPAKLIHLLLFTVRYIEVLKQEYHRLRQAMKCRGFRPATNWHSYRMFGFLVGMMVIRAVERSERILQAMKCRGFSGKFPLTRDFCLLPRDYIFAAGFAGLLGLIVCYEVLYVSV